MNADDPRRSATAERIRADLLDSFDEELEEEIDDQRLADLLDDAISHPQIEGLDRKLYFRELFRLQRELVKLQDWVAHHKKKGGGYFRRPRFRREGWRHQADHAAAQPARLPRGGAVRAERA